MTMMFMNGWQHMVGVAQGGEAGSLPHATLITACACDTEAVAVFRGGEGGEEEVLHSLQRFPGEEHRPLTISLGLLSQQLGGRGKRQVKMLCCGPEQTVLATTDDELFAYTYVDNRFTRLSLPSKNMHISKITCGASHTLLICNKRAYGFGRGLSLAGGGAAADDEVVEIPTPLRESVVDIAAGFDFSVIATCQHVYSWGSGLYGRLGLGQSMRNKKSPTLIGGLEGLGNLSIPGKGITLLSSSTWHTVAVTAGINNTNEMWTWGWGKFGQFGALQERLLAVPTRLDDLIGENDCIVQVTTGPRHTALLTSTGKVWVLGQLGPGAGSEDVDASLPFKPVELPHTGVECIASYRWGLMSLVSK